MILKIRYTDEEMKCFQAHAAISAEEWLQHAWNDLVRRCIDKIIVEVDDRKPKALSEQERDIIIKDYNFVMSPMKDVEVDGQFVVVECTDTQLKAFQIINKKAHPSNMIQVIWDEKTSRCLDRIIRQCTDFNPDNLSQARKLEELSRLQFEEPSEERQVKDLKKRLIKT